MKLSIVVFIIFSCGVVYGQWVNRFYLIEAIDYFNKVMQETILQLEQRGFCNLKLDTRTQTISQQMYKWHVQGNVTYSNGYVVSVQKMDVTDVNQQMLTSVVDGVTQYSGSIRGRLNLRDIKIGYDVLAELGEDGDHTFTGTFVHTTLTFQFWIMKNIVTQEITGSAQFVTLSGGLTRMDFMPANNITQVLSRTYTPNDIFSVDIESWGPDVILPMILDVAKNKIEYPRVCLDCR